MKRYYDTKNNRLVYIGVYSDDDFWDKHWSESDIKMLYPKITSPFDYVKRITKKHIKSGGRILEGGCGMGQEVSKLTNLGYDVIGIDYAKKTVEFVKKIKPELNIVEGDVRQLDFENQTFDAYWSFGVIEHFYNGFDEIIEEACRVIKPGGYFFVTFPHVSKYRKKKAKKGSYPLWTENEDVKLFYQFALDEKNVIEQLKKTGFKFLYKRHLSGFKGFKDESRKFNKIMQKIYDCSNIFCRIIVKVFSAILNKYASHSVLLVLKK